MLETKLLVISEATNKAYHSKWAFVVNLCFFLLVGILQGFLVYYMVICPPTNVHIGKSYWWLIVIETVAAICALTANILTIRINKNFFYFNTVALILWTVNSVMLGMYVDNIKIILLYIPIIIRFSRWRTGEHHKVTPRRIKVRYLSLTIILLTIVSLIMGLFIMNAVDAFPILDSFNLVFGIAQALMMAYGIIEGLIFIYPVSVCLLWMNFTNENYIGFITAMIFFINTNANIMAWLSVYHREHGTFKYRNMKEVSPLLGDILNKYL